MVGNQSETQRFRRRELTHTGSRAAVPVALIAVIALLLSFDDAISAELLGCDETGDFFLAGGSTSVTVGPIPVITLLAQCFGSVPAHRSEAGAAGTDECGIRTGYGRLTLFAEFEDTVPADRSRWYEALTVPALIARTGAGSIRLALFVVFEEGVSALLCLDRHLSAAVCIAAVPVCCIAVITLLPDVQHTIAAECCLFP